jgi:hypothetical protein
MKLTLAFAAAAIVAAAFASPWALASMKTSHRLPLPALPLAPLPLEWDHYQIAGKAMMVKTCPVLPGDIDPAYQLCRWRWAEI